LRGCVTHFGELIAAPVCLALHDVPVLTDLCARLTPHAFALHAGARSAGEEAEVRPLVIARLFAVPIAGDVTGDTEDRLALPVQAELVRAAIRIDLTYETHPAEPTKRRLHRTLGILHTGDLLSSLLTLTRPKGPVRVGTGDAGSPRRTAAGLPVPEFTVIGPGIDDDITAGLLARFEPSALASTLAGTRDPRR